MQLYVDMDGVLADFDRHHEAVFGIRPNKYTDNIKDWTHVNEHPSFWADIPPMPDMLELWEYVKPLKPIILTGVPKTVEKAVTNKNSWARKHLGPGVEVRCCFSKEKCLHARPGDVLIDDWTKYRDLWINAGGIWITHVSAKQSITELATILTERKCHSLPREIP